MSCKTPRVIRAKRLALCVALGALMAGPSLAQSTDKLVVDGAWRGPGWYWYQDDMFGIPILAGENKAGPNGQQLPFKTKADCERYYPNHTCTYYDSDPVH